MIILLDQDGVLADFEHAFIDAWRARHPDIAPVAFDDRKVLLHPRGLRARAARKAEAIYTAPGFIRNLPPVPGALDAVKELLALGMDVRICTSPLSQFENCVAEKYLWVEAPGPRRHQPAGADQGQDPGPRQSADRRQAPHPGAVKPRWKHILFDAPYNRDVTDRPASPGATGATCWRASCTRRTLSARFLRWVSLTTFALECQDQAQATTGERHQMPARQAGVFLPATGLAQASPRTRRHAIARTQRTPRNLVNTN